MDPLIAVGLPDLMAQLHGHPDVVVGLVDGPVAAYHPGLTSTKVRVVAGFPTSGDVASPACRHGTFIAGVLVGKRGGPAPAIASGCTLLSCPVLASAEPSAGDAATTPAALADGVVATVDAGAMVLNLSLAVTGTPTPADRAALEAALGHAARQGTIVVAAAGNQAAMAGTVITTHPWVVPVVGYGQSGAPLSVSNLGRSSGSRGLGAPAEAVTSLASGGGTTVFSGTSIAAPFVAATAALLWSAFPTAAAAEIRHAMLATAGRRRGVVPPLMKAQRAYRSLSGEHHRRTLDERPAV